MMRHSAPVPYIALGFALSAAASFACADVIDTRGMAPHEQCAYCHGLDGNSATPDYPKLAGQYSDYLAKALRDYKDGKRKNPIMAGMAAPLTPKDIDNLAAYYSAQPSVLETKPR